MARSTRMIDAVTRVRARVGKLHSLRFAPSHRAPQLRAGAVRTGPHGLLRVLVGAGDVVLGMRRLVDRILRLGAGKFGACEAAEGRASVERAAGDAAFTFLDQILAFDIRLPGAVRAAAPADTVS